MKQERMVVGIDLAKSVFQIHVADARGKVMLRKRVYRAELAAFMATLPQSVVAMEACGGAHYWGRLFEGVGHEVRLMAPQFVKPYVKSNKNDAADAEAIVEAVTRPGMRCVAVKREWQQDILAMHRIRTRLVRQRTALMNEIRGLLQEYGIVFPKGVRQLREGLVNLFGEEPMRLSTQVQGLFLELYDEWCSLDQRLSVIERRIREIFKSNEVCQRIERVEGVGPITATALVATVGDPAVYNSGRAMSASIGLTPRQHSSGGGTRLLGISKRGDAYVRQLLIHGARNVVRYAAGKTDRRSRWVMKKLETRGFNKTCVAIANKNARICWALMRYGTTYKA